MQGAVSYVAGAAAAAADERDAARADELRAERDLLAAFVARYDVERIVGYVRDVLAAATAAAPRETAAARARAAKLAAALDVLLAR